MSSPFDTIDDAVADIRAGRTVIVCDGEDRENEGDLVMAAQFVTPESVNFMAREARGLICLALSAERCEQLGLNPMTRRNQSLHETAFTVSIEARDGVTTGISAHDRARTIQTAIDPASGAEDLVRPGHVFPLRARPGGVLERSGHTEAAVDLARLAGLSPAGVICEILNEDGTMARVGDLIPYARRHGLRMITVAQLIAHRRRSESIVERVAVARLPTPLGVFRLHGYRSLTDGGQHLALVYGEVAGVPDVLTRVHSECVTGEVFGSLRCDCGPQLHEAMRQIAAEGRGAIVYLAQEGRGIGLLNKVRAYELQDTHGMDTVDANLALGFAADLRDFGIGANILADLGLSTIRLLTNNPRKIIGLEGYGLRVSGQVALEVEAHPESERYMLSKALRLGHTLGAADPPVAAGAKRPPAFDADAPLWVGAEIPQGIA
ncbi:MAG TPA: bifunctional 3,4-dihydroxy-2-butanone-4-phosphate synthase/GTP cyclohydrolase II [Solirubrobacteraceae bacterium]|nr:bifunctional 3,4-dihydroxy-2-butanone-4-phosphate synthase/GTP cyclohydrolase II [Solirubrobacteraceae bacterium]